MLFDSFSNEEDFRDRFVGPLLNQLGYYGVTNQHGIIEFGKDFVFSELHRLGGFRNYVAQVKHIKKITPGSEHARKLLEQVRQAFTVPFRRGDSPRECYVSAVFVINSGEITPITAVHIAREIARERYGDNVHFLCGDELKALNDRAIAESGSSAIALLHGLKQVINYNQRVLQEMSNERCWSNVKPPLIIAPLEHFVATCPSSVWDRMEAIIDYWRQLREIEHFSRLFRESSFPLDEIARSIQRATNTHSLGLEIRAEIYNQLKKFSDRAVQF